jgi:ERCC4-type nuclease
MRDDAPSPIYIDKRVGSNELYAPLQARGVPVELTTLEFGDCCFIGHGPESPIVVGVERKRITDLLQSMTTGRLSGHQLPGLCESYAFRWLLVEGVYRESRDGLVEIPRKHGTWELHRVQYAAVQNYLLTLTLRGGLHVQRTYSVQESAAWLEALYAWWTRKAWAEHRSHLALHQAADYAVFVRPTLVQRMAAQLPGIDEKAKDVAVRFHTVADMVAAGEPEWRSIPGIGKVTASRVHRALRTRD